MTQDRALDILKTGANVFLTGEPGAGKTHVINQYTNWLAAAGVPVAITASTGIAATHIGGMTIHSWSAVGTRDELSPRDIDNILSKEYVVKRLKKAHVLIIDEISMLDANVLDMVEKILRVARNSEQPFGGMQVILVGDFFQLPPITRNNEAIQYAFSAKAWHQAEFLICYLQEQYRHDDELLSSLLTAIRTNTIEESHYTLLEEQTDIGYSDIEPTRLYTHNASVDELNSTQLSTLPGSRRRYTMKTKGNKLLTDNLIRTCLSPASLILAEDAMVMCTKNNFEAGYVNGTLGRIVGFDTDTGFPKILTTDNRELTIKPATWSIVDHGKAIAEIEQIPLRLAWAITVHKSQGMSLDAAEVDLSRAFVFGQGYVALSRVRTLMGLKVTGMHPNALMVDPLIIRQDSSFKEQAAAADETFAELSEEELLKMHQAFVKARGKHWPSADNVGAPVAPPTKSTYEETKDLLDQHKSLSSLAKARGLTAGTVINHLEHLHEQGELPLPVIERFIPDTPDWSEVQDDIFTHMDKLGTEKLKPIYDATDGEFDYIYLRLARLMYTAHKGG